MKTTFHLYMIILTIAITLVELLSVGLPFRMVKIVLPMMVLSTLPCLVILFLVFRLLKEDGLKSAWFWAVLIVISLLLACLPGWILVQMDRSNEELYPYCLGVGLVSVSISLLLASRWLHRVFREFRSVKNLSIQKEETKELK